MARRSKLDNTGAGALPRARLAEAVADADRRAREAEEACLREHGMLPWELAAARAELADARGAPAEERALLRSLAEAERELYCTKRALDTARSVLAAHVTSSPVPGRKRRG